MKFQMGKDLLFYDTEVFAYDTIFVFKDINKTTLKVFHNDFTGLYDFVKGKTLVSYNGYHYDDVILHHAFDLKTPTQIKAVSDRIINGEKIKIRNYKFESLDCFQQIDPSMPGLKKIESNMGRMILESSISFDIERELSESEIVEILRYCEYDVETTIDVYKEREKNYFEPKESIVKMLNNPYAARWNTTTLSANVLLDKPLVKWSTIRVPQEILDLAPPEVVEMWQTKEKGTITTHDFDNEIVWAFGGLHAANTKKKRFTNVVNLDVALGMAQLKLIEPNQGC